MGTRSAREMVVTLLRQRENQSRYTEDLLAAELGQYSAADRGLIQELAYGMVRWQATLDWLIQRKTTPGRNQKSAVQILLRLGLYQLFWLERIPDHAAVHETVALAKQLGFGPQAGFVNAILRGYLRERSETEQQLAELKVQQPALGYSHPEWLFARWEQRWGRARAIELMDWNNQPANTFARVNTLRTDPASLRAQWHAETVDYEPVIADWIEPELMFELKAHPPLRELASFRKGEFYVQDPSTLLAVKELDPQPGENVLDLCAAPGGKATYIAQRMHDRGRVLAHDLHPQRLQLVQENCTRLGITCVETRLTPQAPAAPDVARFDRVLLDAPCSNTGVLRRRVDLRWRLRAEELERLQTAQVELLGHAALQVKPGARLIYSTCSIEPEENRQTVEAFLAEHAQFTLERERELLPFLDRVDGAYVAVLRRLS